MDKKKAILHNNRVVERAIKDLFEFKMVDPVKMLSDRSYAGRSIKNYLDAANVARETMGMPKIQLYDISEFDDDE